jgi:xylulose-5-phosphate/fructose-6-phosphate phosphoketolase
LRDNPLLRRPLSLEHTKHRLLGHWGASPALSFVWVHLNRTIHGYPFLIHRLAYRFKGHENTHVHGYREKRNINTPFQLAMLNETSRFHLVIDVINRVPKLRDRAGQLKEEMRNAIIENLSYAHEHGTDRPEISDWTWPD